MLIKTIWVQKIIYITVTGCCSQPWPAGRTLLADSRQMLTAGGWPSAAGCRLGSANCRLLAGCWSMLAAEYSDVDNFLNRNGFSRHSWGWFLQNLAPKTYQNQPKMSKVAPKS